MLRTILALLFILAAPAAQACECVSPVSPAKSYQQAKAVFTAHVAELKKNDQGNVDRVTLKVDKTWKGSPGESLVLKGPRSMCSYWNYKADESYLVYADASWDKTRPDELEISGCSRTKLLKDGQIETQYLDAVAAEKDTAAIDKSLPGLLVSAKDPLMRAEAADLLSRIMRDKASAAPPETVPALMKATADADKSVRIKAARALANFDLAGKAEVKEALFVLLKEDDRDLRDAAAGGLMYVGKRDPAVFRALVEALEKARQAKDADARRRGATLANFARVLEEVAGTEAEKAETAELLGSMVDEVSDPYDKVGVIQNLGFMKGHARKAAPKLLAVLKEAESYHLKQYTIRALGDIGAVEAQAQIEPYLKDQDCYVAGSVLEAVYKMNPQGFPAFFREKGIPEVKSRFDKCAAEFVWSLQTVGKPAIEIEPFLAEKYASMDKSDWKRDTLKALLDALRYKEKK
ncbi:MAG: hypothetical protein EPN97_18065 [Alphaproteobacteria bacterium]|nr:MAG: hypothetical protein EPN97_18065 [Alphaproteobacteria bacterium]